MDTDRHLHDVIVDQVGAGRLVRCRSRSGRRNRYRPLSSAVDTLTNNDDVRWTDKAIRCPVSCGEQEKVGARCHEVDAERHRSSHFVYSRSSSSFGPDRPVNKRIPSSSSSSSSSGVRWPNSLELFSFCFVTSLMMTSTAAQSAQWIETPRDASALLGKNATFNCSATNFASDALVLWFKVEREIVLLLFTNNQRNGETTDPRYRVVGISGGYSLVVTDVKRTDDAVYQCSVGTLHSRAQLTVLVRPDQPILSISRSLDDLYEDVTVELECRSYGGNPAPSINWYRNGTPVDGARFVPPTEKFNWTSSVLQWTLSADDHRTEFFCSANVVAIPNSLVNSTVQQYNVKYAPRIDLGRYKPLVVVENSTLKLTCNVNANPPVTSSSFQWRKNDVIIAGESGSNYVTRVVTLDDAGVYGCSAANFVRRNASIQVIVHYSPRLTPVVIQGGILVGGEVLVIEGSSISVTFEADANPPVNPATFQWYRNGSHISTGKYYSSQPRREDSGEYRCRATNVLAPSGGGSQMGVGWGVIKLTVQYRPGAASITIPNVVVTGSNVSLECTVDNPGNPPATFMWTRQGDQTAFPNGSYLHLQNVALSDIGRYMCTPINHVGAGIPASKMLDVIEPPQWIQQRLPATASIRVNETGLSFSCVGRGRPAPLIQWTKDGVPLDGSGSDWYTVVGQQDIIDTFSYKVSSTLYPRGSLRKPTEESLRPDDEGQYSCVLMSNVSQFQPVVQSVELRVRYSPIMRAGNVKVAVDANQSAQLLCHARGTPAPVFRWSANTSHTLPQEATEYQPATWVEQGLFPYISAVNLTSVKLSDLGVYTCWAQNEMGLSMMSVTLTVKTVPEVPRNLEMVSQTWESIELFWTPGFDGGYKQDFVVVINTPNQILYKETNTSSTYNVTGLYPSTSYKLSVFARNRLGDGRPSNIVSATTDALVLERPSDVRYKTKTKELTFNVPSNAVLCVRIRLLLGASVWKDHWPCESPASGRVDLEGDTSDVKAVEVAFCVPRRLDVCSSAQNATLVSEDLPVKTIVIVVCVCGGVILILAIILFVLCCRRCSNQTKHSESTTVNLHPVGSSARVANHNGDTKLLEMFPADDRATVRGFVNPVLDQTDLSDKMFVDGYIPADMNHLTELPARTAPPPYRVHNGPLDGSNGSNSSDSGVSDTPKPHRRVIHEVIV